MRNGVVLSFRENLLEIENQDGAKPVVDKRHESGNGEEPEDSSEVALIKHASAMLSANCYESLFQILSPDQGPVTI